jgi:hypothetical protein
MQLSRGSPTCLEKHFIINLTVMEDGRTPPRRIQTTQAKTMQTLGDPRRATVLNILPEASLFTSRNEQLPRWQPRLRRRSRPATPKSECLKTHCVERTTIRSSLRRRKELEPDPVSTSRSAGIPTVLGRNILSEAERTRRSGKHGHHSRYVLAVEVGTPVCASRKAGRNTNKARRDERFGVKGEPQDRWNRSQR